MKRYAVTPAQFNQLRTWLLELGTTLPAESEGELTYLPSGKAAAAAIVLKYHYDGAQLTLSILKRPMLISPGRVWAVVDSWLAETV